MRVDDPGPTDTGSGRADPPAEVHRIHFSRSAPWTGSEAKGEANQILMWGWVSIAGILVFVAIAIVRWTVVPGWPAPLIGLGVVALLAGLGVWIVMGVRRRALADRALWPQPDPDCRVCCVGAPQEVMALGSLDPAMFEPECFSPLVGTARGTGPISCTIVVCLAVVGAYGLARFYLPLRIDMPWMFAFWIGMIAGFAAASWLWPTYYRVVPGRVEIMRFAFRMNRRPAVERWDLRRARLLVDLRRWLVRIEDAGTTRDFTIRFVRGRRRMAYYLLLAAVAREQAPELPDDALLG